MNRLLPRRLFLSTSHKPIIKPTNFNSLHKNNFSFNFKQIQHSNFIKKDPINKSLISTKQNKFHFAKVLIKTKTSNSCSQNKFGNAFYDIIIHLIVGSIIGFIFIVALIYFVSYVLFCIVPGL